LKIFLVRHGETDWNAENRIQGAYDVPLNERGLRQAAELSQRLKGENLTRVFSSHLSRSYRTALEIAKPHGLKVERDRRIAEINQGIWEGLLVDEARKLYAEEYSKFERDPTACIPPAGESMERGFARVKEFWRTKMVEGSGGRGNVAIVAHAAINAIIICLTKRIQETGDKIADINFDESTRKRLMETWKNLLGTAEVVTFELSLERAG